MPSVEALNAALARLADHPFYDGRLPRSVADAGSTDSGPSHLGGDRPKMSRAAIERDMIRLLRARDRLAYAYLMSRHLDFGLQFLPDRQGVRFGFRKTGSGFVSGKRARDSKPRVTMRVETEEYSPTKNGNT